LSSSVYPSVFLPPQEFELALRVFETTRLKEPDTGPGGGSEANLHLTSRSIRNQLAFQLHLSGEYEESLRLFYELKTDPIHVLGLFPSLLPENVRQRMLSQTELNQVRKGP